MAKIKYINYLDLKEFYPSLILVYQRDLGFTRNI